MLNIPMPVAVNLKKAKNVLILGMGGGYDVFAGIPLYFTLQKMGINVHLGNYTHTPWDTMSDFTETIPMTSTCVGVTGNIKSASANFPEMYLSGWFKDTKELDVNVWTFKRDNTIAEYTNSLNILVKHLDLGAILLVDGGVDSIMVGDEDGSGTMMEDTISLAAVRDVDVPIKMLSCVGFGTEVEENLSHFLALENIALMNRQGAFYGTCSLVSYMETFKEYKEACLHAFNQNGHRKSHVQTRVIPAAEGMFGDFHMYPEEKSADVFISPLMSMYWFFNAEAAIHNNKVIPFIEEEETFFDMVQKGVPMIKNHILRERKNLPLT